MEVDDLFVDLADGIKLLKLLEIISGEKLGKPNNGRMRVHKIENVNKSLAFLHTKVSHSTVDFGQQSAFLFIELIVLIRCHRKITQPLYVRCVHYPISTFLVWNRKRNTTAIHSTLNVSVQFCYLQW